MKIIDLLNKIVNGEEVPKRIKRNWEYEWQYDDIREVYCYMSKTGDRFDEDWLVENILNDEVEIIEKEKKIPEKLNYPHIEIESSADDEIRDYLYKVKDKIDEIIDYLKSKGE